MKGPVVALLCIVAAAFAACKEEPKPGELAAKAAVEGYGHLIAGRYADYLAGVAGADSLPAASSCWPAPSSSWPGSGRSTAA